MSPEAILDPPRERILRAVTEVASVAGFTGMSVEAIVATAGVGRRRFYEEFASMDDAFAAQYVRVAGSLVEQIVESHDPSISLAEWATRALGAAVDYLHADPAMADMCIVEALAAGDDVAALRDNAIAAIALMLDDAGREQTEPWGPPPAIAAELLVGGVYSVVYSRIVRGQAHRLPGLVPDMVYMVLRPYLGTDAARIARDRARQQRRSARRRPRNTGTGRRSKN